MVANFIVQAMAIAGISIFSGYTLKILGEESEEDRDLNYFLLALFMGVVTYIVMAYYIELSPLPLNWIACGVATLTVFFGWPFYKKKLEIRNFISRRVVALLISIVIAWMVHYYFHFFWSGALREVNYAILPFGSITLGVLLREILFSGPSGNE